MIRLALRVRREDAELALAELLALAPSGVEELDIDDAFVEFAVYGAPGELPELPDLRAAAGSALVEVSTSELPDDWSERWKRFHRPIVIDAPAGIPDVPGLPILPGLPTLRSVPGLRGVPTPHGVPGLRGVPTPHGVPGLRVRPPWEPAACLPDTEEIVIDPGQAFGTGAHDTTRMCLELLLALASQEPARGPLLDIGCGSGVLAIAAAKIGFAPVLGLDHEPESVQATRENARVNGVTIESRRFDLRREALPRIEGESVPILLANLVRPLLLDLAVSLADDPPRCMIVSGLLREEADGVVAAFQERLGLYERERRNGGEWAAVWLSNHSPWQ